MINLKKYNKENKKHIELIKKMLEDKQIKKEVSSIYYPNKSTYVISAGENNIGLLKFNKEYKNEISIDIAILEEYRNQKYGKKVLKYAINMIDDKNLIIIRTHYYNKAIISISLSIGFSYDYEQMEKCAEEGVDYTILTLKK